MKKTLLVLSAIAISYSTYAQMDSTTNRSNQNNINNNTNDNLKNNSNTNDGMDRDKNSIGNTDNGNMTRTPIKNKTNQTGSTTKATNSGKVYTDGVMMKDGRMMIVKNGNMTAMSSDQTMQNGTIVMSNGKMKHKDGTTMMMKEGGQIDFAGNNVSMDNTNTKYDNNPSNRRIEKNPNDKNMYLVPDSTLKKH